MNAASKTSGASHDDIGGSLLTKEQLRARLNLESVRKVEEMMKARMIPYLKLGHKTVRFDWPKVEAALLKFECKAVGQD